MNQMSLEEIPVKPGRYKNWPVAPWKGMTVEDVLDDYDVSAGRKVLRHTVVDYYIDPLGAPRVILKMQDPQKGDRPYRNVKLRTFVSNYRPAKAEPPKQSDVTDLRAEIAGLKTTIAKLASLLESGRG